MPSLIRLLVVVGLLGGAAYGAMFALANFVEPKPRDMTITIPQQRLTKPNGFCSRERGAASNAPCGTIRMKPSHERLIEHYLDLQAPERSAAAYTLGAYLRDVEHVAGGL